MTSSITSLGVFGICSIGGEVSFVAYSILKLFHTSESHKDFIQGTYFGASPPPRNSELLVLSRANNLHF